MSRIRDEVYSADRINAMCEQLAGFIMREILDPRGKIYHDGHINRVRREGPSIYTINITCIFVNISKHDVLFFVYL